MLCYYYIFFAIFFLSFFFNIIRLSHKYPKNHTSHFSNSTYTPPSYPIIGCLVSFYKNRRRLLNFYTHHLSQSPTQTILLNRLGARRTIITANPANVEYILKTNFTNFPKGKPFTEILGDLLGCGIFNVDGNLWSKQRKLASHEFTTRSLKDFVAKTLEDEVQHRLIPLLELASNGNHVIDMQDVLRRLAFEIVCKVSLGYDPCCLDLSKPLPALLSAFDKASEISAMRAASPVQLIWKIKRMLNVGSEKSLKEAVNLVHESVNEIIRKKKKEISEKNNIGSGSDLLTKLLEAGNDEIMVRDMVISMIMAGRDTTSAAMTWLLWLLSKNPSKEELIVKGVREVFRGKNNDDEFELMRSFDYEGLKEMKYLKACLCESMRLYPPVAWDSKHATGDDMLPDGTRVGKGDRVTYFPYGMGRMEALWGKDWYEFKPDRWFDESVGKEHNNGVLKVVSPYKFSVFQAGPRICLGKDMAFIQMLYVVASILNRFEFKPVSVDQPIFVPFLTAYMAGGFKVRVHKRVSK